MSKLVAVGNDGELLDSLDSKWMAELQGMACRHDDRMVPCVIGKKYQISNYPVLLSQSNVRLTIQHGDGLTRAGLME